MYLKFKGEEAYIRGFNYGGITWTENFKHPLWDFPQEECERLRDRHVDGEQHLEIVA